MLKQVVGDVASRFVCVRHGLDRVRQQGKKFGRRKSVQGREPSGTT
jgi:hypothetical protein